MSSPPAATVPVRSWLPLWLALALIWGSSFTLIKIGLAGFEPLQLAVLRTGSGAVTVVAAVLLMGLRLPRAGQAWLHSAVVGLLLAGLPAVLFAFAETRITSVLAGLFNAGTPIFTALAGLLLASGHRIGRNKSLGLAIGLLGVGLMLGAWQGAAGDLVGSAAAIGATACYGLGIQWQQRHLTQRPEHPVSLVAAQLLVAGAALLAVDVVTGSFAATDWQPGPTAAVITLGAVGTGIAFIMFFRVLSRAGALTAATITYATPVVSTALGVVALGEVLSWNQPVGAVVVLTGVALVQGFLRPLRESDPGRPTRAEPEPTPPG